MSILAQSTIGLSSNSPNPSDPPNPIVPSIPAPNKLDCLSSSDWLGRKALINAPILPILAIAENMPQRDMFSVVKPESPPSLNLGMPPELIPNNMPIC